MHLKKVNITDIGCIKNLELTFKETAGWHVLIGDNGVGKSSILRAIALAIIGYRDAATLRLDYFQLVRFGQDKARIELAIKVHEEDTSIHKDKATQQNTFRTGVEIELKKNDLQEISSLSKINGKDFSDDLWKGGEGWFAASFGPFRRFSGGSKEWDTLFRSNRRAAAHLSVFGEDVALTESINWLINLNYQKLEKNEQATYILRNLKKFINESGLLNNVYLHNISSEGVYFKDSNGETVSVTAMSDGFRSILSLIFELIRQMLRAYHFHNVFKHLEKGAIKIDLPGVVLIDEIDAHLHPTWQARIGQCLTTYFPNIQFIVTTHSPLICRAAEKGSIWQLTASNSAQKTHEITGIEKDRLIYGNVLEAFGTNSFGQQVERSAKSQEMLEDLATLEIRGTYGQLSKDEKDKMTKLRKIFTTDDTLNL